MNAAETMVKNKLLFALLAFFLS